MHAAGAAWWGPRRGPRALVGQPQQRLDVTRLRQPGGPSSPLRGLQAFGICLAYFSDRDVLGQIYDFLGQEGESSTGLGSGPGLLPVGCPSEASASLWSLTAPDRPEVSGTCGLGLQG